MFWLKELHELSLKNIATNCAIAYFLIYLIVKYVPGPAKAPSNPVTFEMDARGIRRLESGKLVEGVEWAALNQVSIRTTSGGPWLEDFYFELVDRTEKGCLVPQLWPRSQELLLILQKLPRWDDEAVIKASGCTSDARFLCWKGSGEEAAFLGRQVRSLPSTVDLTKEDHEKA